jgi:hypothetical protein
MRILAAALLALASGAAVQAQPLRDPFVRPAPPPAAVAAESAAAEAVQVPLQLRAIMVTPGRSLVNINGHILAVGEWVGEYRVVRIRERSVTLATRAGAKNELTLDQTVNK